METNMGERFYDRVWQLCKERGITLTQVARELNIHISTTKGWKTGQTPSANYVVMFANYFDVSTDYILGETDNPSTVQEVITDKDLLLLQRVRARMSQPDRDKMMKLIYVMFDYAFENEEGNFSDY